MYITALEVVVLGDSNPDAFDYVMTGLGELKAGVAKYAKTTDEKSVLALSQAGNSSSVGRQVQSKGLRTANDGVCTASFSEKTAERLNPPDACSVDGKVISQDQVQYLHLPGK